MKETPQTKKCSIISPLNFREFSHNWDCHRLLCLCGEVLVTSIMRTEGYYHKMYTELEAYDQCFQISDYVLNMPRFCCNMWHICLDTFPCSVISKYTRECKALLPYLSYIHMSAPRLNSCETMRTWLGEMARLRGSPPVGYILLGVMEQGSSLIIWQKS